MRRERLRITAIVTAPSGGRKTFGVIEGLTLDAAQIATSLPLAVGEMFRFRLFLEDPPAVTERHGRVVSSREVVKPERLVAESRVRWLTRDEAEQLCADAAPMREISSPLHPGG